MAITTDWYDDDQQIVLHVISGRWTIDEILLDLKQAEERMLDGRVRPRYFIIDMREADGLPTGVLARKAEWITVMTSDSLTVVVGAPMLVQIFALALLRLGGIADTVFVDSFEEAEAVICQPETMRHH